MTSRVSLIAQQSWSAILGDRVTGPRPPPKKNDWNDTNIDVANQSFCLLSTFADMVLCYNTITAFSTKSNVLELAPIVSNWEAVRFRTGTPKLRGGSTLLLTFYY